MDEKIDHALASRLKLARQSRGLTLEALSERSGVSRAVISKIERAEVSPTAATLGRLAGGLDVSLASLFNDDRQRGNPLSRFADQAVWTDPATGYVRRNVSPAGAGVEIVDVTFPPGERVMFDNPWTGRVFAQQVWVLEGELEMLAGGAAYRLCTGDCLHMRLDAPTAFHNSTDKPIRYVVVIHESQ